MCRYGIWFDMKTRHGFAIVFAFVSCLLAKQGFSQVPDGVIEDWVEMEDIVRNFAVTAEFKFQKKTKGVFLARRDDLFKREERPEGLKSDPERVDLVNQYGFTLYKPNESWQLADVTEPEGLVPIQTTITAIPHAGFSIYTGKSLREVLADPDYSVVSWLPERKDANLFALTISCSKEDEIFETAVVVVDPANRHRVAKILYDSKGTQSDAVWSCEYGDESSVAEVIPNSYKLVTGDITWNVVSINAVPPPENEFTLAYYGLPDYVPARESNAWLWLSIVGAVIAMTALILNHRRTTRDK